MTRITNLTQFFEEQVRDTNNVHSAFVVKYDTEVKNGVERKTPYIEKASKLDRFKFLVSDEARGRANIELAQVLESWRKEEEKSRRLDDTQPSFADIGVQYLSFEGLGGMKDDLAHPPITARERMAKLTKVEWLEGLSPAQFERFHKIEMIIHAVQKGWDVNPPSADDLRNGSQTNLSRGSTSSVATNWTKAAEQRKPELGFVIRSAEQYNTTNREILRPAKVIIDPNNLYVLEVNHVPREQQYTEFHEQEIVSFADEIGRRAKNRIGGDKAFITQARANALKHAREAREAKAKEESKQRAYVAIGETITDEQTVVYATVNHHAKTPPLTPETRKAWDDMSDAQKQSALHQPVNRGEIEHNGVVAENVPKLSPKQGQAIATALVANITDEPALASHYAQVEVVKKQAPVKPPRTVSLKQTVVQATIERPPLTEEEKSAFNTNVKPKRDRSIPATLPSVPHSRSSSPNAVSPVSVSGAKFDKLAPLVPPKPEHHVLKQAQLLSRVASPVIRFSNIDDTYTFMFNQQQAVFHERPRIEIVNDPHNEGQWAYKVNSFDVENATFFPIPKHADIENLMTSLPDTNRRLEIEKRTQALARGEEVKRSAVFVKPEEEDKEVGFATVASRTVTKPQSR